MTLRGVQDLHGQREALIDTIGQPSQGLRLLPQNVAGFIDEGALRGCSSEGAQFARSLGRHFF